MLEALGHPGAFVTDESVLSDFPLRDADEGPSLTERRIDLGVRVRPDDRLVDIAQRLRAHAEALIRRAGGPPDLSRVVGRAGRPGPLALPPAGH
jgi:hypothetical protein